MYSHTLKWIRKEREREREESICCTQLKVVDIPLGLAVLLSTIDASQLEERNL